MTTLDPPLDVSPPGATVDEAVDPATQVRPLLNGHVRTLLTHLTDVAVLVVDRELRYVGAGGAGLANAGWDPEELLGRRIHEVVPGSGGRQPHRALPTRPRR